MFQHLGYGTPQETGLQPAYGAGLRNAMLTATKGTAVLNTIFKEYAPWCGDILTRENGSLVGHETGQARRAPWVPWMRLPTHLRQSGLL